MKIAFGLVTLAVVAVLQQAGFAAAVVQQDTRSFTIDWTQVLVIVVPSVVTGFVTVMLAILTLKTAREAKAVAQEGVNQSVETHKSVNSRMDALLALTKEKYLAEGKLEGKETERATNLTEQVAKTAEQMAKTTESVAKTVDEVVERVMSKEPQEVVVVKPAEVIVIKPPEKTPDPEKKPPV